MLTVARKLLELIRFSHTVFALPFAALAAALAWKDEPFRWADALGILLCMVFARSAAMAFNRLADRHLDARNPRTAARHLPAGTLSAGTVWLFTFLCCAGFIMATLLFFLREPSNPWRCTCRFRPCCSYSATRWRSGSPVSRTSGSGCP
jgi:4-hydroxybenzoate polyprenyltransferase